MTIYTNIPVTPVSQDVFTPTPTMGHARSWVQGISRSLAEVQEKRRLPQTKAAHAALAERETRYSAYIKAAIKRGLVA